MKIPQSIRVLYEELKPGYDKLKELVDRLVGMKKEPRWHYESRVKQDESFAALRELTGRDTAPTPEAWRKLLDLPARQASASIE